MTSSSVRPETSFRPAGVGAADLLYLVDAMPDVAPEVLAGFLRYEVRERAPPDDVQSEYVGSESETARSDLAPAAGQVRAVEARRHGRATFYRVLERRSLDPDPLTLEIPPEIEGGTPLAEDEEPGLVSLGQPLEGPDLAPWSRLWPFLRLALGDHHHSRRLDLPRLVRTLAHGLPLRRLPRLARLGWAPVCQVLVDRDVRLLQFWNDFRRLCIGLHGMRGGSGLEVLEFEHGPEGPCRPWAPGRREPRKAYGLPDPGTPVLVLSDLGCLDGRTAGWEDLGRRLRRAGLRPVALMPCPERYWQPEIKRCYLPIVWDRGRRYPNRVMQAPETRYLAPEAAQNGTERLLDLLSPALHVEPALLRAVRRLHPASEIDVGCEAAVWRHPDLYPTPLGALWNREGIDRRRQRFRALDSQRLKVSLRHLVRQHHRYLPEAQCAVEELVLAELEGRRSLDEDARQFLADLYASLKDVPRGRRAGDLGAWVLRIGSQIHQDVWHWDAARPLAAAMVRAARRRLASGQDLGVPTGFDYRQVLWDLEERGKGSAFRLTQNGDFLHLESDGSSDHTALGRIVLSKGWVQWWHEAPDGRANAPSLRGADCAEAIPVPEKGLLHLQAENEKLTIDGLQRPEWASGIMRTQYGLRVTPKKAENAPLYWADPGLIELRGVGGAVIGRFERTHGCFMGESLFLTLREEGFRYPDWADAFGKDEYGIWAEFEYQGVRQRMRWIWPGEFLMGSPETEVGRNKDEVQHEVMLTRGYWLADTTCTQALWKAVTGKNPSSFKGDERPVDYVIWEDGRAFCERLNRERPELALRLPTEAEWEYACRAGETKPFSFGETITTDQANFDGSHPYGNGPKGESGKNTVDVKALPPNTWGLYQMHGNVWEWCQDGYGEYPKEPAIDPVGPATRSGRVLRGGCWIGSAGTLRSAVRLHGGPGGRVGDTGFRLARGRTGSGGEDR